MWVKCYKFLVSSKWTEQFLAIYFLLRFAALEFSLTLFPFVFHLFFTFFFGGGEGGWGGD